MLKLLFLLPLLLVTWVSCAQSSSPAVRYSELLLFAIRDKQPVEGILKDLGQYKYEELQGELSEDKNKKSFWVNIYNAFVAMELPKHPEWTSVPRSFYKQKIVRLAGKTFALNDIEKKMLGTGGQGLQEWDYRLLFALNKGTVSSPDILVYDSENVDQLLNVVTKAYLKREVKMGEGGFDATVPIVFKKRVNDFGGKEKVIEILRFNEVIYMNLLPRLEYKLYDNTVKPGNFLPADQFRQP